MSIEITTLSNGLRVISERMPHVETVSLGIWVGGGSRAEMPGEHGIAHMLEHMAFKGTKRRSAREIAEEIEAVGGELNAATSAENTAYYARILKEDVSLALDILGDILRDSVFAEEELSRERAVVLQEIAASRDNPEDVLFDVAQSLAFPDQPLGRPILGTSLSVRQFRREHLFGFRNENYGAKRMILSAAGAVDHATLVREAEKWLGDLPPEATRDYERACYIGGYKSVKRPLEQGHILIAFEAPSYRAGDYYTAQVYAGLLGGGMSSRLFQEVRERRGLCYAIYAFCWGFSDTGLFGIHAATGPSESADLIGVIGEELRDMAEHGPREEEIVRAKANLKAGLLMSLESSGARAEQLARHLFVFDRPPDTAEIIGRVECVSRQDVRELAEKLLKKRQPTCVSVGPHGEVRPLRAVAEGGLAC